MVLDSAHHYFWDPNSNEWRLEGRHIFTYDANKKLTNSIAYYWDQEISSWTINESRFTLYDDDENLVEEIVNYHADFRHIFRRSVYTYDDFGNLTEKISFEWDSESDEWVLSDSTLCVYDDARNLVQRINYYWDSGMGDWRLGGGMIFVYDGNGNQIEYAYYSWNSETSEWVGNDSAVAVYCIFLPNPLTDFATITLSDKNKIKGIEIIDINGRSIKSIGNVYSNSVIFHRENLPGGIYFVRVYSENTYVKKVLIR